MAALMKLLGLAAAVYLSVLLFLYVVQRSMIYHPDPTRPEPADWGVPDMSVVSLGTDDGLRLFAWWKPPEGDRPVIVYFHGNGGHIGYRGGKARGYLDRGYGLLLVEWRGYGGNPGSPTESGLYADGRAAVRFLEQQGVESKKTVLYGESLGSGVAVELAAQGVGGALVLEAPFTSLGEAAGDKFPIFPVRWLVRDRFASAAKIARITAPLLIIHGADDLVIDAAHGRSLLERANEPKKGVFVPNAGHNDLYEFGGGSAVLTFLDSVYP